MPTTLWRYFGETRSVVLCVSKFQKVGNFTASIKRPKANVLQHPLEGLYTWTPLGGSPLDPLCNMSPICQILNTPQFCEACQTSQELIH